MPGKSVPGREDRECTGSGGQSSEDESGHPGDRGGGSDSKVPELEA